ncbi:hypothetical protein [Streptomyces sp. NPDC005141]
MRRPWLEQRISSAVEASERTTVGSGAVVVVGEPGCGKTVLAAQLALAWRCPCIILRTGSTDSTVASDPKNVLVSLGLQLRTLFGPDIFGGPDVQLRARVTADSFGPDATGYGAHIDVVCLSPFKRVLIDAAVDAADVRGEVAAVRIGELRDVVDSMSESRLAQEAVVDPLRRLAELQPNALVRVVVDGLDESEPLSRLLPLGPEGPVNLTWVVTSRPGRHLHRFTPSHEADVVRLDLDAQDAHQHCLEDAERYVNHRFATEDVANAVTRAPRIAVPPAQFTHQVAQASNGNFLYLHHLLHGLEETARDGLLPPALDKTELPASLEGIYRYLVSERLHERAGVAWQSEYAPVLGVLAAARAPLRVHELAAAADTDEQAVDNVLGNLEQFIERTPVSGDAAFALYHRSFGEFLLTQDRSRNPRPLRPPAEYHARLAASLGEVPETDYGLRHMAGHLAEAGQIDRLASVIMGPFLRRQWEILGSAAVLDTLRLGVRAAAELGRDALLVTLLDRGADLEEQLRQEWESGTYILALCDTRAAVEQRGRAGGMKLPYSGFLATERLLDLEAPEAALTLLRDVLRRPWTEPRPERVAGIGFAEGTLWDSVEDSLVHFLARVAALDADIALALTSRLYPDGPDLPNVATAWRDTLKALMTREPTAHTCKRATDTTMAWLSRPRYAHGVASLVDTLWEVFARAAPTAEGKWFASTAATASALRVRVPSRLEGTAYDNLAATLGGQFTLMESLDGPWADALRETLTTTLHTVPLPELPQAGAYSPRASSYGHLAWLAHRLQLPEFAEMAAVALDTCALDASLVDRSAAPISTGLAWLEQTTDEVRARVEQITARHNLDGDLAYAREAAAHPERPKDVEASLNAITEARTVYAAGRSALAMWRRETTSPEEVAQALSHRRPSSSRPPAHPRPRAADLLREALVPLLTYVSAPWALEMARDLSAQRQADRRLAVTPNWREIRRNRWSNLAADGSADLLRAEVLARWEEMGSEPDEAESRMDCCLAACSFDPDLADRWWNDLVESLDELDRGAVVVLMVDRLATAHPDRLSDLGRKWIGQLPRIAPLDAVTSFEIGLCQLWSDRAKAHPLLQEHLELTLRRFAHALESEFQRVSADDSEDGWPFIGNLVGIAGAAGTGSAAATKMSQDVLRLWQNQSDATTATEHALGILRGVVDGTSAAMHSGPAADVVVTLLDTVNARALNRVDCVTALQTARRLKAAAPATSHRTFETILADVGREQRSQSWLVGIGESIAEVMYHSTASKEFKSLADKMEFRLVESLVSLCTSTTVDRPGLLALHKRVMEVDDVDRRSALFASLAVGWLRLGDLVRARAAAAVATTSALGAAGYYNELAHLSVRSSEEQARSTRPLILDSLLRCQEMTEDAATSVLIAWFGLRSRASTVGRRGAARVDPEKLRVIVRAIRSSAFPL